jgi:hypothetical protein
MTFTFTRFKKRVAILAIFCMLFTLMPLNGFALGASDISGRWDEGTIQNWVDNSLINGYPDGTFKPDNNITRAEFIALVNRAFGYTETTPISFTDVNQNAWYALVIAVAVEAGYILGYPDGTMKPENPISREEVASIIMKIKNLGDNSSIANTFTDAASLNWSKGAVGAVLAEGIMLGYPDGSFGPQNFIKRGETVVVLDRAMNNIVVAINTVDNATVEVEEITTTTLTTTPDDATITAVSGNTDVATVTVNGHIITVTGVSAGTSIITVTGLKSGYNDGTIIYSVTVSEPVTVTGSVAAVDLGMAGDYAILAKTGIATVPTSAITGDIGVSPVAATGITGFDLNLPAGGAWATSSQVTGKVYAPGYADPTSANLTTAISNMETAYTDAAGRAANYTELYAGDISGKTLTAGVYKWSTDVLINTDVTLNGGANDVWIFQIAGQITQASNKSIILTGGAQAKNIFWQSAQTVAIGTGAHFEGIILGMTNITLGTNASINGRLLAQSAVTLDQSTVAASE